MEGKHSPLLADDFLETIYHAFVCVRADALAGLKLSAGGGSERGLAADWPNRLRP